MDISKATLERFPLYHRILRQAKESGLTHISSEEIGRRIGIRGTQIRKDLTCFKEKGTPSVGYNVDRLKTLLEEFMGINLQREAIIAGVGDLGKALTKFAGFSHLNISITEAFDSDPNKVGTTIGELTVKPEEDMIKTIQEKGIVIGIITVPVKTAQDVADEMVSAGIRSIWNFAPTTLKVPEGVFVRNENLSVGFALVGHKAKDPNNQETP